MEYLQTLLDNSSVPAVTAFLLGLLTAISPCPLATNIAAIGYLSKEITDRRRIFIDGLLYTLGRIVAYTLLGAVLIALLRQGASIFSVEKVFGRWGDVIIAPAMIIIGLFMLFGHRLNLPGFGFDAGNAGSSLRGRWKPLLLGAMFAMAFCPTSGIFYFGMLIPMSAAESGGYLLPVLFATATGLPVAAVAWILAYSAAGIGRFYGRVRTVQLWLNRIVALLFIATGIYYATIYILNA